MLVNKIAESGLIVLDLEDFYPSQPVVDLDISAFLFRGLVLREKEFRASVRELDTANFNGRNVAVHCSTDAIIPQWAWMLMATTLDGHCEAYFFGKPQIVEEDILINNLKGINIEDYRDERVIIKGCGKLERSGRPYLEITKLLLPVVRSLMFGEPCSTVPVYKKK